jgi:hypothetical protein
MLEGRVEQHQALTANLLIQPIEAAAHPFAQRREQNVGIDRQIATRLREEIHLDQVEEVGPVSLRNSGVDKQPQR